MTAHNHYFRTVPDGVTRIDVYRLLDMFDVTCPVAQHVIKKALAAGQRGHKTTHRDWQDIADSARRKLEMIQEDDGWNNEAVEEAALATVGDTSVIKLTPFELQSGIDRVQWAEGLILQLPEDHDGRNSWLLNYGVKKPIIRELYTEAAEARMDVAGLVEALEIIEKGEDTGPDGWGAFRWADCRNIARAALAAYRKQGGDV